MFWFDVNLRLVLQTVCVSELSVSCMTCSVCRFCLQSHVHGDVKMSCGLFVSLLSLFLCLVKKKNVHYFYDYDTGEMVGFLWKKICPRNNVACWNLLNALVSRWFHCFLDYAYWKLFVLAAFVVLLYSFGLFVSRNEMISNSERHAEDVSPYRSLLML